MISLNQLMLAIQSVMNAVGESFRKVYAALNKKAESPDWNENNPDSLSYIEGRPGGYMLDGVPVVWPEEYIPDLLANLKAGQNVTITKGTDEKTWIVSAKDTTYDDATNVKSGLLSAEGKKKLDKFDDVETKLNKFGPGYVQAGKNVDTTIGYNATAEGRNNTASGSCSHAEGSNNTASGECSHAEGSNNTASGSYSHAEGRNNTASGSCSHAEGSNNTASGIYSHAEGFGVNKAPSSVETATDEEILSSWNTKKFSLAKGNGSHVEGRACIALNDGCHAEGGFTTASGDCSHAEGYSTTASGSYSHAEGEGTIASGKSSHAQGRYNIEDTEGKYAHIVGNGVYDNTRSNIHTIDWDGNAWFRGDVYIKSTSGTNKDEGSKRLIPIPEFTEADNGKTLGVVDGKLAWVDK